MVSCCSAALCVVLRHGVCNTLADHRLLSHESCFQCVSWFMSAAVRSYGLTVTLRLGYSHPGSLGYSMLSVLVLVVFPECVGLLVILGVVSRVVIVTAFEEKHSYVWGVSYLAC